MTPIEGTSVNESRLDAKATRILHRNNAQEILQALATLEEHRAEFATRWLWELIQNARDFPSDARPMTIRITMAPTQIRFAHNGRDFTEDEILSLIYHGSTKQANADQLGKFGTGFLSTHLLSKKVRVKGMLLENGDRRRPFEFQLDRSGENADEVGEAMQRSFAALKSSLARGGLAPSEWTEFVYQADGALDSETLESQFPFDAIPYILVFDDKIDGIELKLPDKRTAYQRAGSETLETGSRFVVIEEDDNATPFLLHDEDGICAAVPLSECADGGYDVMPPGAVPRFFKFLPLVNSVNLGLPAVFHSPSFAPTENRDGLHLVASGPQSEVNKELLVTAGEVLVKLARVCGRADLGHVHRLLDVSAVADPPAWLGDRAWYEEFQGDVLRDLFVVPLIKGATETLVPVTDMDLPCGDETIAWEEVYRHASALFAGTLPDEAIVEECAAMAAVWPELLGEDDELVQSVVLTPSRLIDTAKEMRSLQALGARLGGDADAAMQWLNGLIGTVPAPLRRRYLDVLMPDQTPEGTFHGQGELSRDLDIDEDLKNILEHLGDAVRKRLLHEEVIEAETMIVAVQQREPLVASARDMLKKQAALRSESGEFREACLGMFAWLATEERWSDLRDSMPVFALGTDESETLSKTGPRALHLAPRDLWPRPARAYWDAFPSGSVLSDDYASRLGDATWRDAAANQVVILDLLWREELEATELEKYTRDLELDGEEHSAEARIALSKLALVGTESFYNAIRGSRERAARFLRFVLEYVVHADPSWRKPVEVGCECGKRHEVIPCEWFAWIRDRDWVPRRRGSERLSNSSLALLTRDDAELADVITREEHAEFLNLVGINVLEQALLAADQSQRATLRRQLAQLAKLAIRHPDTVAQLIDGIEAHREADLRWRANQEFGKAVEELLAQRLKLRLLPLRIRLKVQFKGYDLGAYLADDASSDVGSIEVEAGTLVAKIEIKATRGRAVSLSNRQGEAAEEDPARFWLCVVPLGPEDDTGGLTDERIEALARFVPDIGSRLAPARDGLRGAAESAEAGGFDLEHIDDIRYGIRDTAWDKSALPLKDFVERLGKEASTRRS